MKCEKLENLSTILTTKIKSLFKILNSNVLTIICIKNFINHINFYFRSIQQ